MSSAAAITAIARKSSLKPVRTNKPGGHKASNSRKTRLELVATSAAAEPAAEVEVKGEVEDLSRRDTLILRHLPLVTAIAVRVHESLPVHVDLDDLIHAGVMGLFEAATKYEEGKMVAFPAYAKHRIKGAILDSLRQMDCASRDLRRRLKHLEASTQELSAKLNREPSANELAAHMGITVSRLRCLMIDLRNLGLLAAQGRVNPEQEERPAQEVPCKTDQHPDKVFARDEMRSRLESAMSTLPRRYRQVVTLYYDRDMTMKEIGGILGVNESRVSQIHKSALARMQNVLASSGIASAAAF